jgi:hypothetical protein
MENNQLAISGTKYEIKVTYTTEQEFIESSFKEQKCAALSQRSTLFSHLRDSAFLDCITSQR